MQSGSGRHVRGFDPARLAAGQHCGHAVDMRAAQGRAAGFQAHLGGKSNVATCFICYISRRETTPWDLLPHVKIWELSHALSFG
jgi:hypothetical protein